MSVSTSSFETWAFQAPNLILAAIFYTLLARFVLSFLFPPDSDRVFWHTFVQVTQPVVRPVRAITPLIISDRVVVLLTAAWVMLARFALIAGALLSGNPSG